MLNKVERLYFYTVDDVIFALEDITKNDYNSIFDNDFFRIAKDGHDQYGVCVNLSLFYRTSDDYNTGDSNFTLADVTDKYKSEFIENANWLKMSPHAWEYETQYSRGDRDFYEDYLEIKKEAERFAGTEPWYPNYFVVHFYNGRAQELRKFTADIGTSFCISREFLLNGRTSYLSSEYRDKIINNSIWKDQNRNIWHIARSCCLERALGVVDPATTDPFNKIGDFFDYFTNNHPNHHFIDVGTHEVYFTDYHSTYNESVVESFFDMCKWMDENGFKPGFPDKENLFKFNWL